MSNTLIKNRWSLFVVVVATLLTLAIASKPAQAHHYTTGSDGNGCAWTHMNDGTWLGACIKPYNAHSGWIWAYDSRRGGWQQAGHYNARFMHLYAGAFTGLQYELAMNRNTGKVWYGVGNVWMDAPPNGIDTVVIGPSSSNTFINLFANAGGDVWLRPDCTASYNGC